MDPNEALRRCRAMAARCLDSEYEVYQRENFGEHLAECFQALDAWLVRGGFLPADWERAR